MTGSSVPAHTRAFDTRAFQTRAFWREPLGAVLAALLLVTGCLVRTAAPAHADVTTAQVDTTRTAYDPNEPHLSPSDVSASDFGLQHSVQLDGQIYATPIVVGNTAFVATETNHAYGIDVSTGSILWQRSLGTPFPASALDTRNGDGSVTSCPDLTPSIGSTSTGVYDPSTGSMFFTTKVVPDGAAVTAPVWYLHSVSLTTGAERYGYPMAIQGTADNAPNISFNSAYQMQRPGLLLANGVVYIGFGAHCDYGKYQGWVVGVNVSGIPKIQTSWVADPGVTQGGGIWMSGGGLVMDGLDAQGNPRIFVTTGNGASPPAGPGLGKTPKELAESIIRLGLDSTGHLKAQDFFSPWNADTLDLNDTDFGSGAPVALPDSYGTPTHPHLIVTAGKDGRLYVLDRDNLGGRAQGPLSSDGKNHTDATVQTIGPFPQGFWNHPAIYPAEGGYIYVADNTGQLYAFKRGVDAAGDPQFTQAGASQENVGYLGGMPVVTSSGTDGTGVVWITSRAANGVPGQLRAYSAVPQGGVLKLLASEPVGNSTKFASVATSDGRVITGTQDGQLMIFGRPTNTALAGVATDFGTVQVGQQASRSVTLQAHDNITVVSAKVQPAGSYTVDTSSIGAGKALASGDTLSLPVTFKPTTWGPATAELAVTYRDATGATRTTAVDLHGVGRQEGVGFVPSPLSFGEIVTGSYKTTGVSVVNTGSQAQQVVSVTCPGKPFSCPSVPPKGTQIGADGALTIPVTFTPTTAGTFSGKLTVATATGTYTETVTGSSVSGTAHMVISPMSIDLGPTALGTTHTATFTVSNTGNIAAQISISKPPSGQFSVPDALPEGMSIGPDDEITLTVQFTPTALGRQNGAYAIDANDGLGRRIVTFTGTGVTGTTLNGPTGATDPNWQLNGSAHMGTSAQTLCTHATDVCLTDNHPSEAGSLFAQQPMNSAGLDAKFQVQIGGGTGADGQTFVLAPATMPATAVGGQGGALGWGGITKDPANAGVAVTFDTFQGPTDPSNNFVGVTANFSTSDASQFTYISSHPFNMVNDTDLRKGTHNVEVSYYGGVLRVVFDGAEIISAPVTLPAQVRPGFTGGSGGSYDEHIVRNIAITSIPTGAVDTTGPTVAITSPTNGATLSPGTVTVAATASDAGTGVASVGFAIDGVSVGTSTTAPYTLSLDTTKLSSGSHRLTAIATDKAGNTTTSAPVTFTVASATAPTITLTAPRAGSICSAQTPIRATASGGTGTLTTRVSVDGRAIGSATGGTPAIIWDTTAFKDGAHRITVTVTDAASHQASAQLTCRSVNPPTLSVTTPSASAALTHTVTFAATAVGPKAANGKPLAIARMSFAVSGKGVVCTLTKAPWSCSWNSTTVADGRHQVTITVVDVMGHVSTRVVNVVVKNH